MPFNANSFVNQTFTGANSTRYVTAPEGDYTLMIDSRSTDVEKWMSENEAKKGPNAGRVFVSMDVPVEILDDTVRATLQQEHVYSRYRMILDFDKDGRLDFSEGKNVKLGKLRDALHQNDPSQPWNPVMLGNSSVPFKGHVIETPDKTDPTVKYSEVSRVTRA